jgi:hypothetical protein
MGSTRPAAGGRTLIAGALLAAGAAGACVRRPPVLIPPSEAVQAVEGFGSASISGAEASIKGKFGFVFRRPGLGRIEAVDALGRTAFVILFREGRAWFVLPGRKVFAEDGAAAMMERFLSIALLPDEALGLLSGTWSGAGAEDEGAGWRIERDDEGRIGRGASGDFSFAVRAHFRGDGVPRELDVAGPGASGRVRVLKLGFDPPPRDEVFDTAFLRAYAPKTWEEILELLER